MERLRPFATQEALLRGALEMFRLRRERRTVEKETGADPERIRAARGADREATRRWHRCVRLTGRAVPFAELCAVRRLGLVEREILMILVLERLALIDESLDDCAEIIKHLGLSGSRSLSAIRALSESGRLHRAGLIMHDDPDDDLRERRVYPDPVVVESFLHGSRRDLVGWPVTTEGGLLERLGGLTSALRALSEAHDEERRGYGSPRRSRRALRRVEMLLQGFEETLRQRPDWKIGVLLSERPAFTRGERVVILALVGKELGHLPAEDALFSGGGLVRAASQHASRVHAGLSLVTSRGRLQRDELIQPCGGSEPLLTDDPHTVAEVEFELTERSVLRLGLDRGVRRRPHSRFRPRDPAVRLDQLVLPERVEASLRLVLAHARHARTLLDDWGFAEVLPYGRTIGVLLAGPPGVGKTACAEAIAHELGRPILVVDYSQVQNSFVGQTEKNVVRIFREARSNDAVLFWDEADAMFYDRNTTRNTWEARDVNVLLQELERFDGVCVLATNRKIVLDAALSRRVAIKIEIGRPDRDLRRRIWRKLLPEKMPLEAGVDLDRLAAADLSGGEIKNVIVNAARRALTRGADARVTMADFAEASRQERENRWGAGASGRLGFSAR
jgi:AAA+ superfamily predicted ATPase